MDETQSMVEDVFTGCEIEIPNDFWENIFLFIDLLLHENKITQLISRNDEQDVFQRHVLESLALVTAASFAAFDEILDLGSGGGLPGIPLAILFPKKKITLVESKKKRTLFLRHVASHIKIKNVEVIDSRLEDIRFSGLKKATVVTARAVSSLVNLRRWSDHIMKAGCRQIFAMKGGDTTAEIESLKSKYPNTTVQKKSYNDKFVAPEKQRYLLVLGVE